VIESEAARARNGRPLREITDELGIPFIFKSSFDKANRSSRRASAGRAWRAACGSCEQCASSWRPVLTDVHEDTPLEEVASVVDVLQTPAFLAGRRLHRERRDARQARQYQEGPVPLALGDEQRRRQGALDGQRPDLVCERGFSFGYNNLVVRHALAAVMRETGCPGRVRRDAFRAASGGRATLAAASASSSPCWPRGGRGGRRRRLHGDASTRTRR
jgi:2-dehydro-3-deoxyphosphooctonate aldolase (KDO 8-P synthase)